MARGSLIIAVVAFVLGLIPFVGFISWLVALAAIVVAIVAMTRPNLPKGMAVAGLVVGILALIVGPSVAIGSVIGAVSGEKPAALGSAPVIPTATAAAPDDSTGSSDGVGEEPSDEPAQPAVETKSYTGSGDKVVRVDYEDPIVVKFSCSGCSGNVSVKTDSGTNTLPVNEIGRYSGRFLLNAQSGDLLTRFVINADAPWKLTIKDPTTADLKHVSAGATLKGTGDDVIVVDEGVSDSDVRNVGDGNFVLQSYGGSDSLPVNEIGSYKGNVVLDGPAIVQVTSEGSWTIQGNS